MANPSDIPMESRQSLHDLPNVIGTGIGPKRVNGEPTDEIALIVLVETKADREELEDSELIPDEIDGVPTDVQQSEIPSPDATSDDTYPDASVTREGGAAPVRDDRRRPFIGGVSVGHPAVNAGSSSGLFTDEDGDEVILTNRHIAAEENLDSTGDPFLQPGSLHGGQDPDDAIGTVKTLGPWQEDLLPNVDAAIVSIDDGVERLAGYLGHPDYGDPIEPDFDLRVIHPSRKTGLVSGPIYAVDVEATIDYGWGQLQYQNLVSYEPITEGGSSGTVNLHYDYSTDSFRPVGLHFASSSTRAYMMPWDIVTGYTSDLTPVSGTTNPDLTGYDPYFECTILQNEIRANRILPILITNAGSAGSDTIQLINDDTGIVLDKVDVILSDGENEVIEFEPELPEGNYRLRVETSNVAEISDISVAKPDREVGNIRDPSLAIVSEDLPSGTFGSPIPVTFADPLPSTFSEYRYLRWEGETRSATFGGQLGSTFGSPLPATLGDMIDTTEPAYRSGEYALTLFDDDLGRKVIDNSVSISTTRKRSAVGSLIASVSYEGDDLAEWRFTDATLTYDRETIFQGELREVDPNPQSGLTDLTVYGPGYSLESGNIEVTYSGIRASTAIERFWNNYTNFAATVTSRGRGVDDIHVINDQSFSGTPLEILGDLHDRAGMEFYIDVTGNNRAYSFPRSRSIRNVSLRPIGSGYNPSWDTTDYANHIVVYGEEDEDGNRYRGEAEDASEIEKKGRYTWPEFTSLESDEDCRSQAETLLDEYLANDEMSGSIEMVPRSLDPGTALVIDEWDDDRRIGPHSIHFDGETGYVELPTQPFNRLSGALTLWVRAPFGGTHNPYILTGEYADAAGEFRLGDSRRLPLRIEGDPGSANVDAYPHGPPRDEWTLLHYDWSYDEAADRTTVRAGHDGSIESTRGFSGQFIPPDEAVLIGRRNRYYYEGYVDDIRVYSRPLEERYYSELADRSEVPGRYLRSRWPCNEGPLRFGNTLYDIVGGHHGTTYGGVEYRGNPLPVESVEYSESSGEFTMSVDLSSSQSWAEHLAETSKSIRSVNR